MIDWKSLAIACVATAAAMAGPAAAQTAPAAPPPISAYAALPRMEAPALSPDGARLAYVDRDGEATNVVVRDRATGEVTASVAIGDRLVAGVFWASPDHVVLTSRVLSQTPLGYDQFPLMDIINLKTNRSSRVMGEVDRRAFPMAWFERMGTYRGQRVMFVSGIGETSRGGYGANIYRIDLDNGRGHLHEDGVENLAGYLLRPDGSVAARETYDSEDGRWRLDARTGSGWREIHSARELLDPPVVIGFGRDFSTVAFAELDDEGRGVVSQMSLTGESDIDPIVLPTEITTTLKSPEGTLMGLGFYMDTQEYAFLDPALQARWGQIRGAFPGKQVTLASRSDDFNQMVMFVEGPGDTGSYYLFDATAGRMSLLRRTRPDIPATASASRRAVTYEAADGLTIQGYLTLPPGREAKDLPLVVIPHGGPQSRDDAGFDWRAEAIASRGYAVLQPNFRGSEGFGRAFIEAGYGEWGRKMQSDLSDGVQWLAGQGMVDPARVCIVGSSYGGYAALAAMTINPGVYRCAVSVAGVSDLRQMLRWTESEGALGRRNPTIRYWNRFMGADGAGDLTLDERSPAKLAAAITGPVLLIHGRNDTVVPFEQSELMLAAGRAAGKPVRMVTLDGEDHYLSFAPSRLKTLEETIAFLLENNPPD